MNQICGSKRVREATRCNKCFSSDVILNIVIIEIWYSSLIIWYTKLVWTNDGCSKILTFNLMVALFMIVTFSFKFYYLSCFAFPRTLLYHIHDFGYRNYSCVSQTLPLWCEVITSLKVNMFDKPKIFIFHLRENFEKLTFYVVLLMVRKKVSGYLIVDWILIKVCEEIIW